MNCNVLNFKCEGFVKLELLKDSKIVRSLEFKNMILNSGLKQIASEANLNPFRYCIVGTGNSAESAEQTALDAKIASIYAAGLWDITNGRSSINQTEHYTALTVIYTSAIGAVVGNISEIGISNDNVGNNLLSRTRVKDSFGNPTSIPVAADEQLKVTYEFRLYQPLADFVNVGVNGYNVTIRSAKINSLGYNDWGFGSYSEVGQSFGFANVNSQTYYMQYSGDIGAVDANPAGTSTYGMSDFSCTYVSDGVADLKFTIPTTAGNFTPAGVRSIAFAAGPARFQAQFDPAIPKTADDRVILDFRIQISRKV